MTRGRFEIHGNYYFRLRAPDNELLIASDRYASEQACRDVIISVKTYAFDEDNYERRSSDDGRPYFVLKGRGGEVLATSTVFSNAVRRDAAISAVKRHATMALVVTMP